MDFDAYYQIKIDKEQGLALISALNSHIRRMTRDLQKREIDAEEAAINGETPRVAAISAGFPHRKKRIKLAEELRDTIKILINDKKEEQ